MNKTTERTCETCKCNVMGKYDDICDDCDATFKNWRPKPLPAAQDADEWKESFQRLFCVSHFDLMGKDQKVAAETFKAGWNAALDRRTSRPVSSEVEKSIESVRDFIVDLSRQAFSDVLDDFDLIVATLKENV